MLNERHAHAVIYYPMLLGVAQSTSSLREWAWRGGEYPGTCFAPLVVVADETDAKIVAAINWPPRRVSPLYSLERITLRYDDHLPPGASQSYRALISRVHGSTAAGDEPWRLAVEEYKRWLHERLEAAGLSPISYPLWMRQIHGWLSIHLQNQPAFTPSTVQTLWSRGKAHFPWMQFWGQMSNYAGPNRLAVPPLAPGESTGCCLDHPSLHARYLPLLPIMAKEIAREGHVGYYSRPRSPYGALDDPTVIEGETNLTFLVHWLQQNEARDAANAFYIDVLGHHEFGDPLFVARLFKTTFSANTVIEYPVDLYPTAFLVSGALNGGGWHGGPERTPDRFNEGFSQTTFPRFGRFLLDEHLLFLGENNNDGQFWGPAHAYWTERQAFLLGAKFDVIHPTETLTTDEMNHALRLILEQRDEIRWWDRWPRYLDRQGLSDVPTGVDVRRFQGRDGETLLVIDNWQQRRGQSLLVEGRRIPVPGVSLSIILLGWIPPQSSL